MRTNSFKIDKSYIVIFFLGLIYIFLPSTNNSLDAFAYAAEAKSLDTLFRPHHLLYNIFGYASSLLGIKNSLSAMIFVNGLFAVGCLIIMRSILLRLTSREVCAFAVLFLGSCFGFMRFATENETYIVPLFFSLWASLNYLRSKNNFTTSLLASIACIFHQIHFFWWLGLFILALFEGKSKGKTFMTFFAGALIVPIAYLLVFFFTEHDANNIFEYVFHDYIAIEGVEFSIKPIALLLTPISFIRSFVQVHGYFYPLIQKYHLFILPILTSIILFIVGVFKLRKSITKKRDSYLSQKRFASSHLLIFFLQLIFAFISDGNAEFMVMLPFAFSIFFFAKYDIKIIPLKCFSLGLLIWNLFLGVVPYHFLSLNADKKLAEYIRDNPSNLYILSDRIKIEKILDYNYPDEKFNIKSYTGDLDSIIYQTKLPALTDIVNNTFSMSRSTMVNSNDQSVFDKYNLVKADSLIYNLGILNITRIEKK